MFREAGQSFRYKHGEKDLVINYFKHIVEDEMVVGKRVKIPGEIREIAKGHMTESALQTLWVLPSPWLWGSDDRDYSIDVRRSPAGMWKDGDRSIVLDYMRVLADNLEY